MATRTRAAERREDALSRERIVAAAVELLDETGEGGLTFRTLAAHLRTGPGAIYWHVANKTELLNAATDAVVARTVAVESTGATPEDAIRAVALSMFDAIDVHPWVGSQLTHVPAPRTLLRFVERLGQEIQALGVPVAEQFGAASALLNYILGAAGRNAANARAAAAGTDRAAFLATVEAEWSSLDPEEYPFMRNLAGQVRGHDDRAQFMAGVELILAGITTLR